MIDETAVTDVLARERDPYLDADLLSARLVRELQVEGDTVRVRLVLPYAGLGAGQALAGRLRAQLEALPGVARAQIDVAVEIPSHAAARGRHPLPGIRNLIAVASGKGGVGKSTTAVNLALALAAEGARVGILDADIYGPSQPRMLGAMVKAESHGGGKRMAPVVRYGVQSMSVGYLIDAETPAIWRGPIVTQVLNQLLRETDWDDLDFLVVDLPPGTGDIHLSLAQQIPLSGAIIVTTPQDIALLDARKGLKMFQQVEVPVLGVVENMSTHVCSHCGHEEPIFGSAGGERLAAQYDVPLLGSLPLDMRIREQADNGRPTVIAEPDGDLAARYREIAREASARLLRGGNEQPAFPAIRMLDD